MRLSVHSMQPNPIQSKRIKSNAKQCNAIHYNNNNNNNHNHHNTAAATTTTITTTTTTTTIITTAATTTSRSSSCSLVVVEGGRGGEGEKEEEEEEEEEEDVSHESTQLSPTLPSQTERRDEPRVSAWPGGRARVRLPASAHLSLQRL